VRHPIPPFTRVALLALALLIGGCGGTPAADRTVDVTLDEWTLTAARASVGAGEVAFESRNDGAEEHELLIVRTRLSPERITDPRFAGTYVLGAPHDHFSEAAGLRSRHLGPGRSRRDVVDLTPGDYVLFCGLPGHLENGQAAALRVTP
jgi:uncharacterized cupredoxin-like copper-binding protein